MTRKYIIAISTFMLIVSTLTAWSQDNFRVGISMGNTIPIEEFKSADQSTLNAGFAESGFTLNFDGDYYIHNRLAITARFNFGMSSINKPNAEDWLDSEMFDYLNKDLSQNHYSVDYWQWSSPMVGLKYNYPIVVNKLYIETGAFSGISIIPTPDQNLQIVDQENDQIIYSENIRGTSISIPIMLDAGLRIILNDNIQLQIKSNYFQAKADYEHINYLVKDESPLTPEVLDRKTIEVPVKTVNLSIGLIYKINNQK